MKKISVFVIIVLQALIIACTPQKTKELESLNKSLMTLHDEVMPKTMKISEIKKQVLAKAETVSDKTNAEDLARKLQTAEDKMYTWMDEFGKVLNTEKDETKKIEKYKTLLKQIEDIKNTTETALSESDSYIKS
jgi:predicted  nucleic acid-binding Zn-ribbon protein